MRSPPAWYALSALRRYAELWHNPNMSNRVIFSVSEQIAVRVPHEVLAKAREVAAKRGRSLSFVVVEALRGHLRAPEDVPAAGLRPGD